jgi:predicted outer membrane protein
MTRFPILLATAAVALGVAAPSATAASQPVSGLDQEWLQASIQGDRFEIDGGQTAQSKAVNQAVKSLGARLEADHLKSLKRGVKLAKTLGISRPSKPSEAQQWELLTTATFTGADFDRHYTSLEVADHKDDIDAAKHEIQLGSNAAVRALARRDLKVYRTHLKLSEAAATAVGA